MTVAEQVVTQILQELKSRSGFDGFWDGLDRSTRVDIEVTLTKLTAEVLLIDQAAALADEAAEAIHVNRLNEQETADYLRDFIAEVASDFIGLRRKSDS